MTRDGFCRCSVVFAVGNITVCGAEMLGYRLKVRLLEIQSKLGKDRDVSILSTTPNVSK